jgi:hypothetical protein
MRKTLFLGCIALTTTAFSPLWGFFAHEHINRLAVFTLPAPMIGFYKAHISEIVDVSVMPDKRRYAVADEAPRHYLDADHYGDSALAILPETWRAAVERFGEDTLSAHGILPWHIARMQRRLTDAFLVRDPSAIIRISGELGHYIADAHVPLHTTVNYNGQLTGQEGIHGLWESRLPELFFNDYYLFVGKASYIEDPQRAAWNIVRDSHLMVKDVLSKEKQLSVAYGEKRFSFETRGNSTVKVYAREYATAYHLALDGMVEKQLKASIKVTGDMWYTAWVDAGQPDLTELIRYRPTEDELRKRREEVNEWRSRYWKAREHE